MRFVYKNVEGMLRGMARAMCRGIVYPIIDLQIKSTWRVRTWSVNKVSRRDC